MKDEEEQETTAGEEEMGTAQEEAGEEKNIRRPIDCCHALA